MWGDGSRARAQKPGVHYHPRQWTFDYGANDIWVAWYDLPLQSTSNPVADYGNDARAYKPSESGEGIGARQYVGNYRLPNGVMVDFSIIRGS